MIDYGLVSGPLPKAGVIVVAVLVGVAILTPERRARAIAMLALLVLTPALLLADVWDSPRLHALHHHPLVVVGGAVVGLALIVGLAAVILRRPWVLAPLVVLTLPFRIPITLGSTTSNLLIPLYVVLAAGSLAYVASALGLVGRWVAAGEGSADGVATGEGSGDGVAAGASGSPPGPGSVAATWLERLLVAYVLLYAVQSTYSADFQLALQQVVFFYVPFALGFCLLRRLQWSAQLLRTCLLVAVALAVLFALIGFGEYVTRSLFLNQKLIATNQNHPYFAVNSVFYDSNIFGRFLALVMILVAVTLLYDRPRREQIAAIGVLALLWVGLVLTLSRSSLGALLAGLGLVVAVRWRITRALVLTLGVVVVAAAAVAISPHTFGLEQGFNGVFSGRGSLVSGGIHMFGQRPVWGYGSGGFCHQYLLEYPNSPGRVCDSHTLPVTIAAEQGLIGELVYAALLAAAAVMLLRGVRGDPVRVAIAAAFAGLVVHTLVYDDFLSDPITWTLLAVGAALARAPHPVTDRAAVLESRAEPLPARSAGWSPVGWGEVSGGGAS